MGASHRVGLFLRNDEERELLRAAVADCGLQAVDLSLSDFRTALGFMEVEVGETDLPVDKGLRWIVTDEEMAAREAPSLAGGNSFSTGQTPLMALVRSESVPDEGRRDKNQAGEPEIVEPGIVEPGIVESGTVEPDLAYALVLFRPLQFDQVRAQLRQVFRTGRVFEAQLGQLLEDLSRARRIFDSVVNGISVCDVGLPDLPLVYVNPAFEKITGYSADEVCGRNCRFLQGSATNQPGLTRIREAIREQRDAHALLKNYRKDGTPFWNELYLSPIFDSAGILTHFVGIQNDVTQLVNSSERLDHMAHHDGLTGLANRGLLMQQLTQTLLRARRNGTSVAVLFLDLDNFKHVNDVFGHDAGDGLLRVVADRLRAGTRAGETVARLGGDEFIVVLEDISSDRPLAGIIERLVYSLCQPVVIFEQEFRPSASVGAAIFPADGDTPEALIKVADFKMYSARHETRSAEESPEETRDPENRR